MQTQIVQALVDQVRVAFLPVGLRLSPCAAMPLTWMEKSGGRSQRLHGPAPLARPASAVYAELQEQYLRIPAVPGTSWPLTFSHLSNYAAVYYTYIQCQCMLQRECVVMDRHT